MVPVDPNGVGVTRVAGSAEVERALAGPEDEEIGELVPKVLGMERLTGQEG